MFKPEILQIQHHMLDHMTPLGTTTTTPTITAPTTKTEIRRRNKTKQIRK